MVNLQDKLIFIMVGYPGSGKSTLAKKIAQHFNCQRLASDEIRTEMFQSKRLDQAGHKIIEQQSKQAYRYMYQRAIELAQQNKKVVLDASHLLTKKRKVRIQQLINTCDPENICYILVQTPYETIERRMFKYRNQINQNDETIYQAWKRVYGYFLDYQQKGLISWPGKNEGIAIIKAPDCEVMIEKRKE